MEEQSEFYTAEEIAKILKLNYI